MLKKDRLPGTLRHASTSSNTAFVIYRICLATGFVTRLAWF
jgi:hypothetical protein